MALPPGLTLGSFIGRVLLRGSEALAEFFTRQEVTPVRFAQLVLGSGGDRDDLNVLVDAVFIFGCEPCLKRLSTGCELLLAQKLAGPAVIDEKEVRRDVRRMPQASLGRALSQASAELSSSIATKVIGGAESDISAAAISSTSLSIWSTVC